MSERSASGSEQKVIVLRFPEQKASPWVNSRTRGRVAEKGQCSSFGKHAVLRFPVSYARTQSSKSSNMPTYAEAGPDKQNAILFTFRPRCLPAQDDGIA
jgi:hypothetical protein